MANGVMRGNPETQDGQRLGMRPGPYDACAYCGAKEPSAELSRQSTSDWLCEDCG